LNGAHVNGSTGTVGKQNFANGEGNPWLHFWFQERWTARLGEQSIDPRCGGSCHTIATAFPQETQLFQGHASYERKQNFREKSQLIRKLLLDLLRRSKEAEFCGSFFPKLALLNSACLEAFDAPPPHLGVSSIEEEFGRCIGDVEEEKLEIECDIGLQQQEISDLRGANSSFAVGNRTQKKEIDALPKQPDELVAQFGQSRSRSAEAINRICKSSGFYGNKTMHHLWGSNFRSMIRERRYRTALFGI
jgi:hypothetical protein